MTGPLRFSYYPGCSLHATGKEYDASLRAVLAALNVELQEIDGWNCCGASSAHFLSPSLAVGLPARNLALIEQTGRPVIAPCAACFNRLRGAQAALAAQPARYRWLDAALKRPPAGTAVVRSPLAVLRQDIGLTRIAARVRRPLRGLRAVAYYGCLLVRPPAYSDLGDSEHPRELEDLLRALGADPRPWSYGVDCCGGALSIARADVVQRLVGTLVDAARAAGADCIVTACPLCQVNLEMRQADTAGARLPALYFSEAMGIAFDLPQARQWWPQHLVDPRPALAARGLA